jgi:hypothetical protein
MAASSGVPESAELILTAAGYEMNGMSLWVRRVTAVALVNHFDVGSSPFATDALRRRTMSKGANNGRERVQQWMYQKDDYSITSSARASSVGGTSMPSALAVAHGARWL